MNRRTKQWSSFSEDTVVLLAFMVVVLAAIAAITVMSIVEAPFPCVRVEGK
jgi:hypothetical protein